jgi:hypothetical protein
MRPFLSSYIQVSSFVDISISGNTWELQEGET